MFRRNPTRIELKLEDLNEYEILKKELEEKNKLQLCSNKSIIDGIVTTNGSKTREQTLHERIGFIRK